MRFETDRRYQLPMAPAELWEVLAEVDQYQSWWPWLRRFEARALADQEVWACLVQPPLPYWVRFELHLDEVSAPRRVRASVTGDVVGEATLEITERGAASEVRLTSSLEPGNGFLRTVARLAAPVVRYGHDWVLDSGARGFIDRAT